jgi:hypothetical protein
MQPDGYTDLDLDDAAAALRQRAWHLRLACWPPGVWQPITFRQYTRIRKRLARWPWLCGGVAVKACEGGE